LELRSIWYIGFVVSNIILTLSSTLEELYFCGLLISGSVASCFSEPFITYVGYEVLNSLASIISICDLLRFRFSAVYSSMSLSLGVMTPSSIASPYKYL